MPELDAFNSLFSTLKPLKIDQFSEEKSIKKKDLFKIYVADSQPFLQYIGKNFNPDFLTSKEERILNEINRIKKSDDIFGILSDNNSLSISLWEAPYLINMLDGLTSVIGPNGNPLTFNDSIAALILRITSDPEQKRENVELILKVGDYETNDIVFLDDTHILSADLIYNVKSAGLNYPHIKSLLAPVEKDLLESYLSLFLTYFNNIVPEYNGQIAKKISNPEQAVATLYLEKVASDKALYMRTGVSVDSLDNLPADIVPSFSVRIDDNQTMIIRPVESCDIDAQTDELEHMILSCAPDRLAKKEVYHENKFFIIPENTAGPFLLYKLPQVLEKFRLVGSEKLREYKVVAAFPKLKLKLSSGIDFLEGEGDITIGDEHFTIADILSQYNKNRYIKLSDGNRGIIEESYIQRLQRLFNRKDKNGKIRVNIFNLPEVEEMIQSKLTGSFANRSRSVLEGFNGLKAAKQPAYKVNATLRPYQNEGVKWLKYLYDNKLGGCLADDMGLGKTLQTIALLSMIYPKCEKPTLIVMPRSLLFNWEKELQRFCPKLKFKTYYGSDRNLEEVLEAQIILTTYAVMRNDIESLKEHEFQFIVLDESQNIKTFSSQTTMAAMLLESKHRLALSGTPMENNLTELYSLFRFLNPTMFGTLEDFNSSYTMPIQKYGDKDASDSLKRKIYPFILRRLKKDVLKDLPPRIDQMRYVEMSDKQAKFYNERRLFYKQQIEDSIAREGVQKSQFMMFQALNELRRIASVPSSIGANNIESPKIEELTDMLSESLSNNHKCVVFFNFLAGLEIMMDKLQKLGIQYETMTGSTSANERKRIVERFQTDPDCMVLLLTLKVGGVGLNLTAADTVYLFEPWWNKAAEEQAINRLHRIGQQSSVTSFSLITLGTIEEKILQLQEQKRELFNELISSDGSSSKHLSESDIDFILS